MPPKAHSPHFTHDGVADDQVRVVGAAANRTPLSANASVSRATRKSSAFRTIRIPRNPPQGPCSSRRRSLCRAHKWVGSRIAQRPAIDNCPVCRSIPRRRKYARPEITCCRLLRLRSLDRSLGVQAHRNDRKQQVHGCWCTRLPECCK